jgi:hypothetical protein
VSESERDELLRRKAELEERIAFLESEQDGGGLAAVKAEGAAIVAAREAELAAEVEARDAEPVVESVSPTGDVPEPKPKKKRGDGNNDVV